VYAVIESGGRQYKVVPGEVIEVNRLPVEAGQTIDLGNVLMIGGDTETLVGQPTVPGAMVRAKVSGNLRSRKIIVFKYKSKVRYRRFNTHRQDLTRLVIKEIVTGANGETVSAETTEDIVEAAPVGIETSAPKEIPEGVSDDVAANVSADVEEGAADSVSEDTEEETQNGA